MGDAQTKSAAHQTAPFENYLNDRGEIKENLSRDELNQKVKSEGKRGLVQIEATSQGFYDAPRTMLMVAKETGILRANICRYVATLRKANKITLVKKDYCQITQHMAGYYTTNPALFPPIPQQLKLL